jgi:hypothetical protein
MTDHKQRAESLEDRAMARTNWATIEATGFPAPRGLSSSKYLAPHYAGVEV